MAQEDGDIPLWAQTLDQEWESRGFCLAAMDIDSDSDSYVLFPCQVRDLSSLITLSQEVISSALTMPKYVIASRLKERVQDNFLLFKDATDTETCIVYQHVMDGKNPITLIFHDEEDGMWQFLCSEDHNLEDIRLISLAEACKLDESINQVADLPCGFCGGTDRG